MTASSEDIRRAALILKSGGLVAFPTETVYGLGADAENPQAVARIYAAKGRPADHPVIVHLAADADVGYWAKSVPEEAHRLIAAFWPGPLTLILKRAAHIPDAVSGGQDSIGLRCPSHPVAQALLQAFKKGKGGIAAPSANKFGHVSPTTAQHVRDEFASLPDETASQRVDLILDGGQSQVGIESTILDLSRIDSHGPVLLRPGHVSTAAIANILSAWPVLPDASAPRASGTLDSHYAPHTPVALIASEQLDATLRQLTAVGRRVALMSCSQITFSTVIAQIDLPSAHDGYAHGLYAALRALDAVSADLILIETPPSTEQWQGINDRLRRATCDSSHIVLRFLQN